MAHLLFLLLLVFKNIDCCSELLVLAERELWRWSIRRARGASGCLLQPKDVLPLRRSNCTKPRASERVFAHTPPGWLVHNRACARLQGQHRVTHDAVAPGALAEMLGTLDVTPTTSDWDVGSLADLLRF